MKPIFGGRKPTAFDPLHKNRLQPVTKAVIRNPLLEFAHQTEMITKDEYEACLKNDMVVQKHGNATILVNLNAVHPTLKTGMRTLLYMGRGNDIMVSRILGLDE